MPAESADLARRLARAFVAGVQDSGALPRRGRIEFIRLIRSDRLLRVLGLEIELNEAFVHEYVTATLDLAQEELTVHHRGRRVTVRRFRVEE